MTRGCTLYGAGGFTELGGPGKEREGAVAAKTACIEAGYEQLHAAALDERLRPARQLAATMVVSQKDGNQRRRRFGVSRRLRVGLSVAEERVKADKQPTMQRAMIEAETFRHT